MDIHEPPLIQAKLKKTLTVIKQANEPLGYADYYWAAKDGLVMVERKKGPELLGAIGARLDKQLLKYKNNHPEAIVYILLEGIITATQDGDCQTWEKKNGAIVQGRITKLPYTAYRAYMYARSAEGIGIVNTVDEIDTAYVLSSMVYNSMKVSHKGLNELYKKQFKDTKVSQEYATYINMLTSIEGIGEVTAAGLIERWGSPWNLFKVSEYVMGMKETDRVVELIVRGIGKE